MTSETWANTACTSRAPASVGSNASRGVLSAEWQQQHRPVAERDYRAVAGKGLIQLLGRVADTHGQSARLRPEARRMIDPSQRAIEALPRPRRAGPQRDRNGVVGSLGAPDAHRVDRHDESRRRREAGHDLRAVERVGDGARDGRAGLAEIGGRARAAQRPLSSARRACAPAPARRTSGACSA